MRWWRLGGFWAGLICLGLFPFFFMGRMFIDSDTAFQFYPFFFFYQEAVQSGASFLWNPGMFLGFPTYLSQTGGYLDPFNWLLAHLPLHAIDLYHIRLFVDLWLAMALSYLAGRALGLTRIASVLIGLGYLVAFNFLYLSNILIVNGLFLIPFLLYAAIRIFESRGARQWGWAALAGAGVGWSMLSGNAQFTVEGTFLFGLFYAAYFFFISGERRDARMALRRGLQGGLVAVVAVAVALPLILPTFEFKPLTVRADGVSYADAVHKVIEPGDAVLFAFPDFLYFPYVSAGRRPLYIGALLFLLALVGIREALRRGEPSRQRTLMRIIAGLFAFSFVASLKWSPVFYLMLKLPVFELFRFPYRWMYLGIWFLCVLGAYGFDRIVERAQELRRSWLVKIMGALLGAGAALVVALNVLGDWFWRAAAGAAHAAFLATVHGHGPFGKDPAHYREAFERGIEAWRTFLSLGDASFAIPFFILLAACALVSAVLAGVLGQQYFRRAGLGLSVLTFLAVFMLQWPASVPRSVLSAHAALLDRAGATDLHEYRTFPFMLGSALTLPPTYRLSNDEVVALTEAQYASGWPALHLYDRRVASVDGYDVFVPTDYSKVLDALGSTHAGAQARSQPTDSERKERLLTNLDLLGMLSGKYIISGAPLSHPALLLRATTSASRLGGEIRVYENARVLPRWYFALQIENRPHASLPALMDAGVPFGARTYLDCRDCVAGKAARTDSLALRERTSARYEFETRTQNARWLVFTESFLPGWELAIDGVPHPIVRANGAVMAALVPAGEHAVVFRYRGVLNEAGIYERLGIFSEE